MNQKLHLINWNHKAIAIRNILRKLGTTRPAVTLAITGSEIRVEIDDPGAVHPVWLAELAAGLRGAQQR